MQLREDEHLEYFYYCQMKNVFVNKFQDLLFEGGTSNS